MQKTDSLLQNQQASIKSLEKQIGQLALSMSNRTNGSLPSNTEVNPKEQVMAITLRNGVDLKREPSKLKEEAQEEKVMELKPYVPKLSYPQRPTQAKDDSQFLDIFRKVNINTPLTMAIVKMPKYDKYLKEFILNKWKIDEVNIGSLIKECSAFIQNTLHRKAKDHESFTIPCTISITNFGKALCDLGASVNLMSLSMCRSFCLMHNMRSTSVSLQLADKSITFPNGLLEDILIRMDKFIFSIDFIVLDMKDDEEVPLILGRPFLITSKALINVEGGKLTLRVGQDEAKPILKPLYYTTFIQEVLISKNLSLRSFYFSFRDFDVLNCAMSLFSLKKQTKLWEQSGYFTIFSKTSNLFVFFKFQFRTIPQPSCLNRDITLREEQTPGRGNAEDMTS
ncbi:uncharacterized protein LOC126672251 [Mercurialis annua]|uniref:uncharacterized protein LOC126672251 n=1 Tax=Mercurialis annua TaxID=3986 RepID=UPI00215E3511|nr:uncharacterized protein LOC126672251 [Mercurialis annua]